MIDPFGALGPLEREVLALVQAAGETTARALHDGQDPADARAYTTLTTTLDRLVRKGYLQRNKDGIAWRYRPAVSPEALERGRVEALAARLLHEGQGMGLVALVEAADPDTLEQLSQLIDARRRR